MKNGILESEKGSWTLKKKNYRHNLNFDITDVRWSEENGKTKCIITTNGTIKKSYGKRIQIEGIAHSNNSDETQTKDFLRATNNKEEPLTRDYFFHDSVVELEFSITGVTGIQIAVEEENV